MASWKATSLEVSKAMENKMLNNKKSFYVFEPPTELEPRRLDWSGHQHAL